MAITTTENLAPGAFKYTRPEIQDLPYRTPYDHADRWHLSKLCAKLGIAHRDAERKAVLISMLLTAEESGRVDQQKALRLLDEIVDKMTRKPGSGIPERKWVELEVPAINGAPVPATPVVPPSPESELWRFAKYPVGQFIEEAGKLGLVLTRAMKREEMFDLLEKHLKK